MHAIDVLAALIVLSILFLIYCYIGFSRDQRPKDGGPSACGRIQGASGSDCDEGIHSRK